MFGFLKKKIADFVQTVTGKVEQKPPEQAELPAQPAVQEYVEQVEPIVPETTLAVSTPKIIEATVEHKVEKPEQRHEPKPASKHEQKQEAKQDQKQFEPRQQSKPEQKPQLAATKPVSKPQPTNVIPKVEPKAEAKTELKPTVAPVIQPQPKLEPKQEKSFAPQVSIFKKITGIFSSDVELTEKDVGNVFDDMELSLLESDASLDTAQFMVSDLRSRLIGKKIQKNKLNEFVQSAVHSSLLDIFAKSAPHSAFFTLVEQHRKTSEPLVILFVGPNGAGKTTTIAKLAHLLKQRGVSSVISASDTFRAAAIQQSEHHGEKIGVKVIKHDYGSDPAAVAFDAVSHAKSKKIDVVLIDTAGRQETNVNLIEEMKKISRVVKPNLKIFIGETLAGHSVIEQAKKFHEAIQVDGLILTKLDCDAKGGNALSIAHDLSIPIYFVGLGQEYNDLVEFTPELLVSRILAQ